MRAGEKMFEEYKTEYSTDRIEMHTGAIKPGQRVVLVDDLIATGGTLMAGINLVSESRRERQMSRCCADAGWGEVLRHRMLMRAHAACRSTLCPCSTT